MLKLALGTVQFGTNYGISNNLGIPDDTELCKIFDIAFLNEINILDTAPSYGDAEERIGVFSKNRFNVISKFNNVENNKTLLNSLNKSLERIKQNQLYAYMAHNSDELISNPDLWEFLNIEKEKDRINKIGYSIYTVAQLEQLLLLEMMPDIVQIPYNLLDIKFESYLPELKSYGTEIHIRSVYLQGLFFMDAQYLPVKLQPLKSALIEIKRLSVENNLTISQLLLSYVNYNQYVDKIVIGVASSKQLLDNLRDISTDPLNKNLLEEIRLIKVTDAELLNPFNWK